MSQEEKGNVEAGNITPDECLELERLLDKLQSSIGRYCIIPNYIHAGVHIATYNAIGEMENEVTAPSIEWAVKKINTNKLTTGSGKIEG